MKLVINLIATVILLLYMQTLGYLADLASASSGGDLSGLRTPSPMIHAGGALLLLLGATVLSVYKPQGMTRHGQRQRLGVRPEPGTRSGAKVGAKVGCSPAPPVTTSGLCRSSGSFS